jgi:group I intron endonuclease
MQREPGVYSITNTANGKRYIGSTRGLERRLYEHRRQLRTGTHRNAHLQSAWNVHGESNFVFKPLAIIHDASEMLATERGLILALNAADRTHGYNISTEPSNNQLGLKRSDVTCRRIGAAKQGNQNRLGKLHSQETKDLIRQKLTGKTLSVETRAKLSAVRRGVPKSAEWMRKIIESSARTRANKLSRNTP